MLAINFAPFPDLTAGRLTLRQMRPDDEQEVFRIRSDASVAEFVDRPVLTTIDEARQFIGSINEGIARNEWVIWAITLNGQDKLIGSICLWNFSIEEEKAELGYELMPDYQGKGIMQEAVAAVIRFGFDTLKVRAIEAYVNPDNVKSIKLLERNQFIKAGYFKDKARDGGVLNMVVYALKNRASG